MLRTKTGEARSKFDWIETVGREDAEDGLLIGTRFSQRSHEYRVTRVVRVARAHFGKTRMEGKAALKEMEERRRWGMRYPEEKNHALYVDATWMEGSERSRRRS